MDIYNIFYLLILALSIENRSMAEEYEINRPFLFLIVTKGLVIFSGIITDPSQK